MSGRVLVRIALALVVAATLLPLRSAMAQLRNHNAFPGGPPAEVLSPGFSQNSVHDPFSPNYNALLPSNTGWRNFGSGATFGNSFFSGVTFSTGGFFYGGYNPYYWPYSYGYGYPYYPRPFYGAVAPWVAPVVVPAAPVQFPQVAVPAVNNPAVGGFGVLAPENPAEKARNKPRPSTADAKARAQRQIELGDASFSRQSFMDASQHYRTASTVAADVPDGFFRQGFALFALGRYDQAAKMFRKALEMDPEWPETGFQLASLYGDNQLSKGAHLDALVQAVTKGQNADLLFLLGLVLFADDEPARARPYLVRARDLNIGADAHIDAFLKLIDKPAVQVAAPAGKGAAPAEQPAPRAVPIAAGKPAVDGERSAPVAPKPQPRPAKPGSVDL